MNARKTPRQRRVRKAQEQAYTESLLLVTQGSDFAETVACVYRAVWTQQDADVSVVSPPDGAAERCAEHLVEWLMADVKRRRSVIAKMYRRIGALAEAVERTVGVRINIDGENWRWENLRALGSLPWAAMNAVIEAEFNDGVSDRRKHPLTPAVQAWMCSQDEVTAAWVLTEPREFPVLPSTMFRKEESDRLSARQTPDALYVPEGADAVETDDGKVVLPVLQGFGDDIEDHPASLPVDWWTGGRGGEKFSKGLESSSRAAPLPMRLLVELVSRAPLDHAGRMVSIEVTAKELLDALFPHGYNWSEKSTRDKFGVACMLVTNLRTLVPVPGRPGFGWLERVIDITPGVDTAKAEFTKVRVDYHFPVGSLYAGGGPTIDRARMLRYGVENGKKFRALINTTYRMWRPGVTRIPANRDGSAWSWSKDPAKYGPRLLTDSNQPVDSKAAQVLRRLVYPGDKSRGASARQRTHRAIETIMQLVADGAVSVQRGRIMPASNAGDKSANHLTEEKSDE